VLIFSYLNVDEPDGFCGRERGILRG